ncbi:MAG TPA: YceI family protein [Thermodesulfovibrionales bacterium]|nr:YceI family protein [Thermodesulfovibrionales bacterium]
MAKWIIDPDHSVAAFAVRHMMISDVHGQFNRISGIIQFTPPDLAHLSVEAEIDVTGVYTGIQKRDEHLRSPDFLDAANFPKITFKSTKAQVLSERSCRVSGNLTIRGITHQVTLDVEYSGPVNDPFEEGATSIGFTASGRINRKDYDVLWNADMENGVIAGWDVRLTLNVEADRAAD